MEVKEEMIDSKELSNRLKVSQRKVVADKGLPHVKWGRSVRYLWTEVVAHLKASNGGGNHNE